MKPNWLHIADPVTSPNPKRSGEAGTAMVEYVVIVCLVALVTIISVSNVGKRIAGRLGYASQILNGDSDIGTPGGGGNGAGGDVGGGGESGGGIGGASGLHGR